jgi:nucleoside-diphosphate kinase
MDNLQRTLVILKPDAVQRRLVGEILARFERKGLQIIGMKFLSVSPAQAAEHYVEHKDKPFFPALTGFLTSSPVVVLALEGDGAVAAVRTLLGPTDGRSAPGGTIRGDYGLSKSYNLVHASDGVASAQRELALWFPEGFVSWAPVQNAWTHDG